MYPRSMLNKKVDTKVDLHCPEEQVWLKYGTVWMKIRTDIYSGSFRLDPLQRRHSARLAQIQTCHPKLNQKFVFDNCKSTHQVFYLTP